ncbi:MAG: N,N-diacetyllegionaminate synthase [Acidobacteriota bacterium]|jgi:N-acetylneuraminate synthase|nr:N,N-diacetyllegionaminate synthase [Acidobacteriota bacterium]
MALRPISIAGREVGPGHSCFVIAEAGVNHNGSLESALQLVDVAVQAGADAIKFQTFKAEHLVTSDAPKAAYQLRNTGTTESQYEMLLGLELSHEAHRVLMSYCSQRDILFMSTPFDEESADFLDELGVPVFKLPSGEITNLPFITHVARKGKPLIVSTGMAWMSEVEAAVQSITACGNQDFILLHCVSNYPAEAADVNLRAMRAMEEKFNVPVGYSDHTSGIEVALAAVALGACIIEKHFTLSRDLPGPDHRASLEPEELTAMVRGIRLIEAALGHGRKEPAASEAETASIARRSLVAARDIEAGTKLTEALISIKRPGSGLSPAMLPQVLGRRMRVPARAGTLLTLEMLS